MRSSPAPCPSQQILIGDLSAKHRRGVLEMIAALGPFSGRTAQSAPHDMRKANPMQSQLKTANVAPQRAPRATKAPRRRVVDLHAAAWFDLFHRQGAAWPEGETSVETIAAAIRAAG